MKFCIVNGDDFGAGAGVNRGILEAHDCGVLTSASLMVNMPGALDAVAAARLRPKLSLGLHFNLTNEGDAVVDLDDPAACRAELERQLEQFVSFAGTLPTHIDSHHNIHRLPQLESVFRALATRIDRPLREHSPVRYYSNFYGQWDGETHLEQISSDNLIRILEREVGPGITEVACHPGYADADFRSCYAIEREAEIRALCDPRVRARLQALGIQLVGFADVPRILAGSCVSGAVDAEDEVRP